MNWISLLWAGGHRPLVLGLLVSLPALTASGLDVEPLPVDCAWVAIMFCGLPIVFSAVRGLVTAFDIRADVLVAMALIAAVCVGEIFAAGEVAFIMKLGELLEELTVARARAGIERLVHLTPREARVLRGAEEMVIPAEDVRAGDILRVLPGETIAVDGVITAGQTSVDEAVMTGESLPVDKGPGDTVSSGTVNRFGSFDMEATRVGEDSSIQRMISLVRSADAGKAQIVRMADRWATWIVAGALAAAAGTYVVTGEILRSVTILVVFCPCALVLATPTAIVAAIGNATKHSCLVKEGDALERLARVRRLALDKTGTLTMGRPQVTRVQSFLANTGDEALLALAAGAEKRSEHPLGRAVVAALTAAERAAPEPGRFAMLPGRGVEAEVEGHAILAGSRALLEGRGVAVPAAVSSAVAAQEDEGRAIIWLAADGQAAGYIALADTPRPGAGEAIAGVAALGVTPVLLTGDNERAARALAAGVGIGQVLSGCTPEMKMTFVRDAAARGERVCMIGDGINDAPALKGAEVGIAMGGVGSDIAMDAADIVLVNDAIGELPHLFGLAARAMRTIRLNLAFSMTLNFVAIALAMTGILTPVVGALVHNAGSVFVILNSGRLLLWKGRGTAALPEVVPVPRKAA